MPTLVQIQCPHCQALMKLKSRDPLGKKVPCPKCKNPFVAKEKVAKPKPKPKPKDEFDEFDDFEEIADYQPIGASAPKDEFDEFDDFDDYAPRKKRRRAAKAPPKKSSNKGLKLGLIIGGSVLAVLLISLTIWLVVRSFSNKLELAWLPPDANEITVVRYGDLWESSFVQDDVQDLLKRDASKMKEKWGFEPKEIESVTTGRSGGDVIVVIRTSVDLDKDKIFENGGNYDEVDHEGKTYYRFPHSSLFFPDESTVVAGPESSIKHAIERGPKGEKRDELKFVDEGHQILEVKLRDGQRVGLSTIAEANGYTFGSSFESVTQIRFDSVDSAKEFADGAEENQFSQRDRWKRDLDRSGKPESEKKELREVLSAMTSSVSRSGDSVALKSTISVSGSKSAKSFVKSYKNPTAYIRDLVAFPNRLFGFPDYIGQAANPNPARNDTPRNNDPAPGRKDVSVPPRNNVPTPPRRSTSPPRRSGIPSRARPSRRSRSQRVYVLEFEVVDAGKAQEALEIIKKIENVDAARTRLSGNRIQVYSQPRKFVSGNRVRAELTRNGIRNIRYRGRRLE